VPAVVPCARWVKVLVCSFSVYSQLPPEKTIAFLVDLNSTSYTSKALYYFVAAAK
jgi:hypothetical protein